MESGLNTSPEHISGSHKSFPTFVSTLCRRTPGTTEGRGIALTRYSACHPLVSSCSPHFRPQPNPYPIDGVTSPSIHTPKFSSFNSGSADLSRALSPGYPTSFFSFRFFVSDAFRSPFKFEFGKELKRGSVLMGRE